MGQRAVMGEMVFLARYTVHFTREHENLVLYPCNNKSIRRIQTKSLSRKYKDAVIAGILRDRTMEVGLMSFSNYVK